MFNTNDFTLTKGNTNNVKRVMNALEMGRPLFVDKMTHGYRTCIGDVDEEYANRIKEYIKQKTNIEIQIRKRRCTKSTYDMIIPFAIDDENLKYEFSRGYNPFNIANYITNNEVLEYEYVC